MSAARAFTDAMRTSADYGFVRSNLSYIGDRIYRCKEYGMVSTKYRLREDDSVAPLRKSASYKRIIEKLKDKGYVVNIQGEKYGYRFSDDYDKIMRLLDCITRCNDDEGYNGTYLYINWDKRKENR